ncbi:PriCT-2 domain-containing protein [Niabella aquatica]
MSWLNNIVSCYENTSDVIGRPIMYRDILFNIHPTHANAIISLRNTSPFDANYNSLKKQIKNSLPLFTPSGWLLSRAKNRVRLIAHTGMVQIDFDWPTCEEYYIDDLMQEVFKHPFVGLACRSVSGRGFYLLIAIAEPSKQRQYVEHLFNVFADYGLRADTSKGANVHDLRYVSHDRAMLIRENPEPLFVKQFYKPKAIQQHNDRETTEKDIARMYEYLALIESLQLNFCPDYESWYKIGFAFANSLGENGREPFHICSKFYPSYDPTETDKKYNDFLQNGNKQISLGTFFHRCKMLNLDSRIAFKSLDNPLFT